MAVLVMERAMCTTTFETLTLAGLLHDPLIRAVMHSDRVSEGDYEALLFRVKRTLANRDRRVQLELDMADA
jgi:hypothetical protein